MSECCAHELGVAPGRHKGLGSRQHGFRETPLSPLSSPPRLRACTPPAAATGDRRRAGGSRRTLDGRHAHHPRPATRARALDATNAAASRPARSKASGRQRDAEDRRAGGRPHPPRRARTRRTPAQSPSPGGYYRQYGGFVIGGRRVIYVQRRHRQRDRARPVDRRRLAHARPSIICDGGAITFGVEYDPATRSSRTSRSTARVLTPHHIPIAPIARQPALLAVRRFLRREPISAPRIRDRHRVKRIEPRIVVAEDRASSPRLARRPAAQSRARAACLREFPAAAALRSAIAASRSRPRPSPSRRDRRPGPSPECP